ncbi:S41 family peptidase [Campylobacter sp. RM9344]|uniref:S41 family peptidase n=1 Tax=Campylobacter californiensis TaxID=1032243 RepID=A0AAW3ZUL2_9BACT|nr:S41 family peptidase [Campylobacter sp. RM6883]MBE2985954.1 S41 family peptidase [Campylobacter sp. RM12919]MBE2988155.1 S41 family peptidase [Campylobacter sp. RM12920]MBE2994842.1 S41 family peptidase [Campylobacter sp. RM6913]MBE3029382.1 S41 family peptidase [Campylobacter sp. RM9344]MBE3607973.1 S41 family peptidase [Campylobacter sp. RM9337]
MLGEKLNKKFISLLLSSALLATSLTAKSDDDASIRIEALSKLTKTISTVEKYYVDDIKFKELIDKTISGLMQNLDAHSGFLNEKAFKDMQVQTNGEFGGLGITVGIKDSALTVISPIEDTPADRAGIKAGDIILRIDGNATIGTTIDEAVNKMRGKPKTPITITIVRKGEQKPFDVKIIRDIIKVESVYARMIEKENILYLRITNFDKNVVSKASEFLKKYPKVDGVIMDLRNNPGGLLNQAVGLVDLFVDKGIIVSQKGRDSNENAEYKASSSTTLSRLPLAILVNGGSASASEIVSGAFQDHKRGVVVGENTFGKGSVQVILPIDDTEALRLTIARYYLPSGRTIQAVGVTPDIVVYPGKVPQSENSAFAIKESELKAHLQSELDKIDASAEANKTEAKDDKTIISQKKIDEDLQLKTAIDVVKVLKIKQ